MNAALSTNLLNFIKPMRYNIIWNGNQTGKWDGCYRGGVSQIIIEAVHSYPRDTALTGLKVSYILIQTTWISLSGKFRDSSVVRKARSAVVPGFYLYIFDNR